MPAFCQRDIPWSFQLFSLSNQIIENQCLTGYMPIFDLIFKLFPTTIDNFITRFIGHSEPVEKVDIEFSFYRFHQMDWFVDTASGSTCNLFIYRNYNKLVIKNFSQSCQSVAVCLPFFSKIMQYLRYCLLFLRCERSVRLIDPYSGIFWNIHSVNLRIHCILRLITIRFTKAWCRGSK